MSDQKDQRAVNEELRKAVGQGDVDAVRQLLDGMADPNCRFPGSITVLMEACAKGVRSIVQLLMEKGSSVNETNENGWTALHSTVYGDHHEIAGDLLEKQAKVNVVDKNGWTPLHLTSMYGRTATARVLMDHDANPNIQNKDGDTPLHFAARFEQHEIVKLLMEHSADPNIQDKYGDTPLHGASSQQHRAIVEVLMQHKADPTIKNKRGKYPHELAYSDVRQQLRTYWEEYRRAPLMEMGKVSPKTIKAFVIGSVRAGKTTFTLAVTGTGDIVRVLERTPGINILDLELDEFGRLKMHDVAGHDLFHSTHTFFFDGVSALYIYIVDTDLSRDEMLADAIYWLAFIYSGRSPGTPPGYVLILGSRGGDQHQKERQFTLDSVTRELMKKFEGRFIFVLQGKSLVLDMRQAGSKTMEEVKKQLAIGAQNSLKHVSAIPRVCHQIRAEFLPQLRNELAVPTSGKPSGPFTEESQFHALVLEVSDALKDSSLFVSLLNYLEEWGEIVVAGNCLVIDTVWLCRSLIGAVFASKADPQSIEFRVQMNAKADGTATLEEIERVLEDFRQFNGTPPVDPKAGIDILQHMGLALPTEKKDVYRFPALIQESRPEQVWMKKESTSTEPHGMVYVGIRLQCQSDIEMFSPAVMPLLQGEVAKQSSEVAVIMWKGGMLVERNSEECQPEVEALVFVSEKTRATRAIDLIARGQAYCQGDVKQFLDKLEQTTMRMLDKKSPGSQVEKRHLSSKQLSQHVEKPVSYSQEEVSVAKEGKGIVKRETGTDIIKDSVIDLLAVDDGHIIYKLQSLSKYKSHWLELGCILLSSTEDEVRELLTALGDQAKMVDKLYYVVETWIRKQWRTATLETFLNACDKVDSRLRRKVVRELTTSDRRLLPNVNIAGQEIMYEEEIGTDREEPVSVAELLSDNKIFRGVLKFGVAQWSSIGHEMGFTDPEIEACTFNIPALGSKLQAIIQLKVRGCDVEETEKCLLTACKRIPQPIHGAVLDYVKSDSGMSQYESSSISTESAKSDVRLRIRHGATSGDGQSVDSQMGQESVVTGGSVSVELNQHCSSDDQHAQPVSPCQPKGHTTAKHCHWSAIIAFIVILLALLVLWWR